MIQISLLIEVCDYYYDDVPMSIQLLHHLFLNVWHMKFMIPVLFCNGEVLHIVEEELTATIKLE